MSVGYAPHPPSVKTLRTELELGSDEIVPDFLEQHGVGVKLGGHAQEYQRCVYIARGQTFIGIAAALMQKLRVAHDPEFGARLRRFIEQAGFRSARQFAIKGMGWPEDSGAQRLNQYLKGRIPEVETLLAMADALKAPVADLLGLNGANSSVDEGLKGILQHLLALEGIAPDKADTIANALLGAQRLLRAFPDEEPLPTRTKFAAQAAWLQHQHPMPGTQ